MVVVYTMMICLRIQVFFCEVTKRTSGEASFGFQSQGGQPCSCLVDVYMCTYSMIIISGATPSDHLAASQSLASTCDQALVGFEARTYRITGDWSIN